MGERQRPSPTYFQDRADHYRALASEQTEPAKSAELLRIAQIMDKEAAITRSLLRL